MVKLDKSVNNRLIIFTYYVGKELVKCLNPFLAKFLAQFLKKSELFPLFFFKKMASNMPIWPTLSSLTGDADKKTADPFVFNHIRANCASCSKEKFLERKYLRSFANLNRRL